MIVKFYNIRHCFPNRLFEYIQARLAFAVSPLPGISDLVKKYKCGFISEEFTMESITKPLDYLSPSMFKQGKEGCHKVHDSLCTEKECGKLQLSSL